VARVGSLTRYFAEVHIDGTFHDDESWHLDAEGIPFDLRVDD